MQKFLIVYAGNGGIAELYNVGVFEAESASEAKGFARRQWNTTASLYATPVDELHDGWSYFG